MNKTENIIVMIKTLSKYKKVTSTELSYRLNVSRRTVYRYAEELNCMGYPVEAKKGQNGGLWLYGGEGL